MPAEQAYLMSAAGATSGDDLVMQELPQVYYIAARIRERLPMQVDMEDLVSAGVIGLLEAQRSFDSSKNAQFKTFAKFRIRGAILDSLREVDWGSRLTRRRGREIAEATSRLEGKLGRKPTHGEIAQEMEMEVDHLLKILAQLDALHVAGQRVVAVTADSDVVDLIESAPDQDALDPFELCLEGEMKAHLADAIARLNEREQLILSLYYREELTMKEIAKVVGVALSRVSQIRQAAMVKLRTYLEHVERRPERNSELEESIQHA